MVYSRCEMLDNRVMLTFPSHPTGEPYGRGRTSGYCGRSYRFAPLFRGIESREA